MRILFVGDVVGRSGRRALLDRLPGLITQWRLDFVIVNGENAAGGFGITEAIYGEFVDAGADAITLGNHAWDQREALVFIEPALGAATLSGVAVETDDATGLATRIAPVRIGGRLAPTLPAFWGV